MGATLPTLDLELALRDETGLDAIAGLDEAGRGAIAGPVVAAAVILPLDDDAGRLAELAGVATQTADAQRREIYEQIVANAVA